MFYNSRFSFVAALEQYLHDLQKLSLHLQLTANNLLSVWTLLRSGNTDLSLQSFCSCCGPVRSGGADTFLHNLQFLCPGSTA